MILLLVFNGGKNSCRMSMSGMCFWANKRVNGSEEFEMSLGVVNITVSKMTGSNIALLQLAKPVSYTDYIQPVCLDISNARSFPTE
ncbi:uncharacterized protein AKAME5_002260100 [Lates japonicus]|uniref:Uncharacterized protein n=1 Tax=Lates japonicus TaxID=270547 RepID=A0AAD3RKH9_LATJO|nr:uncharacterized protein AKAME5_002260100 [Lates japonicus]